MPKKTPNGRPTKAPVPVPTVTLYQNGDHISGILQQLYRQPLAKQDTTEDGNSHESASSLRTEGGTHATGKVGWFGTGAEVGAKLAAAADATAKDARAGKRTSVWEYTQAYYLHTVKESLRNAGMLRSVSALSEARELQVGDLIEFTTEFEPDQMASFLDVLTPELVSAYVRHQILHTATETFEDWSDFQAREVHFAKTEQRIQAKTGLAEALTRAVRTDFRSEQTKEFFGLLGTGNEAVTVITMCDRVSFTVEDTDRILDGRYTVLAKVATEVAHNRPVLDRNKLLSAIDPKSIDYLVDQMRAQLDESISTTDLGGQMVFDPKISARVDGASFKVIPIAIYL